MRDQLGLVVVVLVAAAAACGPSVRVGDEAATDGDGSSGDVTDATVVDPSRPTTGIADSTGVHDSGFATSDSTVATDVDATTGIMGEPLGCYEDALPDDRACCRMLPMPCPEVMHQCSRADCESPFTEPVADVAAAQCMLAAIAQGDPAVLVQRAPWGLGESRRQWIVGTPGEAITVTATLQDFSFGVAKQICQLAPADAFATCAKMDDPLVLADCLQAGLLECLDATEPLTCPS